MKSIVILCIFFLSLPFEALNGQVVLLGNPTQWQVSKGTVESLSEPEEHSHALGRRE